MKTEILEKAVEIYIDDYDRQGRIIAKKHFLAGVKWQQEISYSEDDLEEAFKSGFTNCYNHNNTTFGEWFEQFKKK